MKSKIEEAVVRIMALPEKAQVQEMVRMLDTVPDEGRETVITYFRITKNESSVAERSAYESS